MFRTVFKNASHLAVAGLLMAAAPMATAEIKSITWVVPVTPGGVVDTTGRIFAQQLADKLGVNVIVENRPGGGGIVAAEYILNSNRSDTLYVIENTQSGAGIIDKMVKDIRYKPLEDFVPVHGLYYLPAALVARADAPFNTTKELIAYANENKGKLNFGTTAPGGVGHFYVAKYLTATGIDAEMIHYKGSAPAITDLMGGSINAMFDYLPTALPQIESGKFKAITAMSDKRLGSLPNVPTVIEDGYPDALLLGWLGAFVKKGTSEEDIATLSKALNEILHDDDVKKLEDRFGLILMRDMEREKFAKFNRDEYEKWGKLVDLLGMDLR